MAQASGSAPTQNDTEEKPKSKKPSDSKFKQQKLPAWQPVMTAKSVVPSFIIIGVIFIPIGAVLFNESNQVKEKIVDYTSGQCQDCYDNLNTSNAHDPLYEYCYCAIEIELEENFKAPVYMYYGLDNFYQNHRRYVKSRDDYQLLGQARPLSGLDSLSDDCDPYRTDAANRIIAPCGAIANSMFNDTIELHYYDNSWQPVTLNRTNIAWPSDRKLKFKNPHTPSGNLCDADVLKNTVKPPNWRVELCQLDLENTGNNGYENEDLIVWMRTAALPNFRKLYRRIEHEGVFKDKLPAGKYQLNITYNYPVKAFDGKKKVILSTVSWAGGKNPFLGIAYIVVGSICILIAVVFTIIHFKFGKKTEEIIDVTDRTPYAQ